MKKVYKKTPSKAPVKKTVKKAPVVKPAPTPKTPKLGDLYI
jgi:hypothetical protein